MEWGRRLYIQSVYFFPNQHDSGSYAFTIKCRLKHSYHFTWANKSNIYLLGCPVNCTLSTRLPDRHLFARSLASKDSSLPLFKVGFLAYQGQSFTLLTVYGLTVKVPYFCCQYLACQGQFPISFLRM